jgi:predicted dinucleotide-binding enzyme
LAPEAGAKAVSIKDAAELGGIAIARFQKRNIPDLPRDLFTETPNSVVVMDPGNQYPRQQNGRIDSIEAGLTESRWVAQQLSRVAACENAAYHRYVSTWNSVDVLPQDVTMTKMPHP